MLELSFVTVTHFSVKYENFSNRDRPTRTKSCNFNIQSTMQTTSYNILDQVKQS